MKDVVPVTVADREVNTVHFQDMSNEVIYSDAYDDADAMVNDDVISANKPGGFERLVQPPAADAGGTHLPGLYDNRGSITSGSHQRDVIEKQGGVDDVTLQRAPHDQPYSAAAGAAHAQTLQLSFQSVIRHTVTAVVRWDAPCDVVGKSTSSQNLAPVSYLIRYYVHDYPSNFAEKSSPTNFVLIDNLRPNAKYAYKVRRISDDSDDSEWSEEGYLDTSCPQH